MSNNNEINRFFIVQNKTIIMFIQSVMLMFNSIIDELFLLQRFLSLFHARGKILSSLVPGLYRYSIRLDKTREKKNTPSIYIYKYEDRFPIS